MINLDVQLLFIYFLYIANFCGQIFQYYYYKLDLFVKLNRHILICTLIFINNHNDKF